MVAVLSEALETRSITGSSSFADAIDHIRAHPVDLVVTDFRCNGDTALTFLPVLRHASPQTLCLILSAQDEIQIGYPCVRAGASGFVKKSVPVSVIVDAVRMVLAGNHYISAQLSKALMDRRLPEMASSPGTRLSATELRVFTMFGECMTVSGIAEKLGVSVKTVESHREHIKNKLGLQTASMVTAAAVRWLEDASWSI